MGKSFRVPEIFTFDNLITLRKKCPSQSFFVCIFSYYSVNLIIQSEYGKLHTTNKSVFGLFSRSVSFRELWFKCIENISFNTLRRKFQKSNSGRFWVTNAKV